MPQSSSSPVLPALTVPGRRLLPAAAGVAPSWPGARILAHCRGWMRRRSTARMLRDLDPRLARDVGVAPSCPDRPDGFLVDPRPLWGIGLAPHPAGDSQREAR